MSTYPINSLGSSQFERLIQSILLEIIGKGVSIFGSGPDGAREATYEGKASFPTKVEQWSGKWIFQVKFHDIDRIGPKKARSDILNDLNDELIKITEKYSHDCDNYILFTNVPLTGVYKTGTKDKIENDIIPNFPQIEHIKVIGPDEIEGYIDNSFDIRQKFFGYSRGDPIVSMLEVVNHELKNSRQFIKSYKPLTAFNLLNELKNYFWDNIADSNRYRILLNLGIINNILENYTEASNLFLEALNYNRNDDEALSYYAFGCLLINDLDKAKKYAYNSLKKNPSNLKAYTVIITSSSTEETLKKVISKVPPQYHDDHDVALAIGYFAWLKNDIHEAEKWFRTAIDDNKESVDANSYLALLFLSSFDENFQINTRQLDDELIKKIKETESKLNYSWEKVFKTEMQGYRLNWLIGRGWAKYYLGKIDEAIDDLKLALELKSSASTKKQLALFLVEKGDLEKAKEILKSIMYEKSTPDSALLIANILLSENKCEEALSVLNNFLTISQDDVLHRRGKKLLLDTYICLKDVDNANKTYKEIFKMEDSIKSNVYRSQICKLVGNSEEANLKLVNAIDIINGSTDFKDLLFLADELYYNGQYQFASEIYSKITNPTIETSLTVKLIISYNNAGMLKNAFKLSRNIRKKKNKPLKTISEIEINILNDIGCVKQAKNLMKEYLDLYEPNLVLKLNKAIMDLHAEDFSSLDAFLDSDFDINELSSYQCFELANLYFIRDRNDEFINTIYETRRKYYNSPSIHSEYIKLLTGYEFKNCKESGLDMAICVEYVDGKQDWFILEDREDTNIMNHEINLKDANTKKMLKKHVGENFYINENPFYEGDLVKVVEIKSKYEYALQKSINNHGKFYSEHYGIYKIDFSIDTIHKMIKKKKTKAEKLEKAYKNQKISINFFAEMMSSDIIDIYKNFTSNPDLGFKCYTPKYVPLEEESEIIKNIKTQNEYEFHKGEHFLNKRPKLIIDPLTLLTLHNLENIKYITKKFGKFGISLSTLNYLKNIFYFEKMIYSKEKMIVYSDEKDELKGREVIPDSKIEYLNNIFEWIKEYCEIIPCLEALNMNRNEKRDYESILGRAFVDTILIANTHGRLLLCDEELLRVIADMEFKIRGTWIHPLLIFCLNNTIITSDIYKLNLIKLICLNYRFLLYMD